MEHERVVTPLEERAAEGVHEEREEVGGERDQEEQGRRTLLREEQRTIAVWLEASERGLEAFPQIGPLSYMQRELTAKLTDAYRGGQ